MENIKAILKPGPRATLSPWSKARQEWTGMTLGQVGVSLFEYVRANPHSIGDVAETICHRTISEAAGGSQSDVLPLPLPIVPEEGSTNQSKCSGAQSQVQPRALESWKVALSIISTI